MRSPNGSARGTQDPGRPRFEWRRKRLGYAIASYTLLVLLLTDRGEASYLPSVLRVGTVLLATLVFVALTWRDARPPWQRALLLPAGLLAAVALGLGVIAALRTLGYLPHVSQGALLYAATFAVFTFALKFSGVFVRSRRQP